MLCIMGLLGEMIRFNTKPVFFLFVVGVVERQGTSKLYSLLGCGRHGNWRIYENITAWGTLEVSPFLIL